jgi:RNA polymerase sigma factor (sigma-70 family)
MVAGRGAELIAIEGVYRREFARYLRVASAIAGDIEVGRDCVHDAFAAAVRHRGQFRGDGPLEAWLWRVVVNSARQYRRRTLDRAIDYDHHTGANGSIGDVASVRAALATLPERERLAVFLRYYADLDYTTLAQVLEVSTGTVGATLHSARRKLAQLLPGEVRHD